MDADAGPPPDPRLVDLRHFDVEKELGRGAFGKVHACIWKLAPPKKGESGRCSLGARVQLSGQMGVVGTD